MFWVSFGESLMTNLTQSPSDGKAEVFYIVAMKNQ